MNVNEQVVLTFTPLQEVIPTFDMAVNELFFERFPDSILEFQIQVRPYNALKTKNMRNLNPEGDSRHQSVWSSTCYLIPVTQLCCQIMFIPKKRI